MILLYQISPTPKQTKQTIAETGFQPHLWMWEQALLISTADM